MKKSFMTRVLAVSLSAAMAFSMSSASNLMTASAASTVNLKTTFKTLKVKQTYKLTLKNNTLGWKITKVTSSDPTICKAYNRTNSSVMLKGKGVGRATITVKVKTTKRKYPKNIKLMKCRVNVKAADTTTPDNPTTALTAQAEAGNVTEVRVGFNQAVDSATAENFTLSDDLKVAEVKLADDKKSALLTVNGMEYGKTYSVTVTGIQVAGKVQPDVKTEFTTPASTDKYHVGLKAKDEVLKSDGQTTTLVTFTITDDKGEKITDQGVEVAFSATLGKFAEQRVSIQNGEATVMYTSEALSETSTAILTARIVESTNNKELRGLNQTTSIRLTPNPDDINTAVGAVITSITAPTADYVVAYFNQKVDAKDFTTANGKMDTSKYTCEIESGIDNGWGYIPGTSRPHRIVGVLPVEENENALKFLVNEPMIDNSNIKVDFENKTSQAQGSVVSAKNTVYCKLTDAHQPSVLDVKAEGQDTIKVYFSEAVLPYVYSDHGTAPAGSTDRSQGSDPYTADLVTNYLIDGKPLSAYDITIADVQNPAGEGTEAATGTNIKAISTKDPTPETGSTSANGSIQVGNFDGKDNNRHVVTIKLGKNKTLSTGRHSIQIANVGDWAAKTDKERNIVNTQSFDFDVTRNEEAPRFDVEVQSPEQYKLKFNVPVRPVGTTESLTTLDSSSSVTGSDAAKAVASILKLQQQVGNSWVTISEGADLKNAITVSKLNKDSAQYLVEVRRDWTEVFNTISSRQNYFNYRFRLHIDANKLVNSANNVQNAAALDVNLDDTIMTTPDIKSPDIVGAERAVDTSNNELDSWNVSLSEPVKISQQANIETLTPSQEQTAGAGTGSTDLQDNLGVPIPTAEFIRSDNGETVKATVLRTTSIDAEDKTINVQPDYTLSPGTWKLVVSSISDDYGRTTATADWDVTVTGESKNTNFEVVWAAVSSSDDYNVFKADPDLDGRYVFVKFNKPITWVGNSVNAGANINYNINGNTLPTGTQIYANIKGYDDHDGVTDSLTIVLPRSTFSGGYNYNLSGTNAILNISKTITATTGETLANGGSLRLPFQYGDAANHTGVRASTDAVWGNDPSENKADNKEYFQAFKAALESNQYRKVILNRNINLDSTADEIVSVFGRNNTLTINRAVDVDLAGHSITGNVVVSTTDAVDEMLFGSINSSDPVSSLTGSASNTDRNQAAALSVNAGNIREFRMVRLNASKGANGGYAVNINDSYKDSFVNEGQIAGDIRITDENGVGFENGANGVVSGKMVVESAGEVNLKGDFSACTAFTGIEVNKAAKLNLGVANDPVNLPTGLKVTVNTPGTRVIVDKGSNLTGNAIVAAAKDVRITIPNDMAAKPTFEVNNNGEFVAVNTDNVATTVGVYVPKKEEIQSVGEQAFLEKINLVTGVSTDADTKDVNVVTCSAVNATSKTAINANVVKAINDIDYHVSANETKKVSATYTVEGTYAACLEVKDGAVIMKDNAPLGDARIAVRLSVNGVTITRYVTVHIVSGQ